MSVERITRPALPDRMANPEATTLLLLIGSLIAVNVGPLLPVAAVRAALVLPVALLAPGYAVLVLVADRRHSATPALASCVLLSIAVYPLLALALHVAAVALTATSVAAGISILLLTALAATTARARRWRGVAGSPFAARRRPDASVLPLATCAAVVLALVLAVRAMPPSVIPEPHHELALAGEWARLGDVARADAASRVVVPVAVANRTSRTERYEIAGRLQRGPGWAPERVTLAPGERWQGSVAGVGPGVGCLNRLTISLRTGSSTAEAATIGLWLRTLAGEEEPCAAKR